LLLDFAKQALGAVLDIPDGGRAAEAVDPVDVEDELVLCAALPVTGSDRGRPRFTAFEVLKFSREPVLVSESGAAAAVAAAVPGAAAGAGRPRIRVGSGMPRSLRSLGGGSARGCVAGGR
jgi:hypothetical protein